jgi:uncharacterized protein (UPF0332 family)
MARLSSDLLTQAGLLARKERRKPLQASLRRALSTTYYALFHFMIEESTRMMIGSSARSENLRKLAARAFIHGKMKSVCEQFAKPTPRPLLATFWSSLQPYMNSDLQQICATFVDMQALRHEADYDMAQIFLRSEAVNAVKRTGDAMSAWKRLTQQNEELARLFVVCLMLWPALDGRQ